jgi:hypothetical protein
VAARSFAQFEKQYRFRRLTEAGMQIDFNDEQPEKAHSSMRFNRDGGANVTA